MLKRYGGWLAVKVVVLALVVGVCGLEVSGAAWGQAPSTAGVAGASVERALVAGAQGAQAQAEKRQAWLASPEAAQQRQASRSAYRSLSSGAGIELGTKTFPSALNRPAWHGPQLPTSQGAVSYVNEDTALVKSTNGHQGVLESSVPLLGHTPQGASAPVDLALSGEGEAFVPASAAVPVSIPDSSTGQLTFPGLGVGVTLPGAAQTPGVLGGDHVAMENVLPDTDVFEQPEPAGADIAFQLRSPESPTDLKLKFALSSGDSLAVVGAISLDGGVPGSAVIQREGRIFMTVSPPSATDAQGRSVAVSYSVDPAEPEVLEMHVEDSGEVAFPVMVDPNVGYTDIAGNWAGWDPYESSSDLTPYVSDGESLAEGLWVIGYGRAGYSPYFFAENGEQGGFAFRTPNDNTYVYADEMYNLNHADYPESTYTVFNGGIFSVANLNWEPGVVYNINENNEATLSNGSQAYFEESNDFNGLIKFYCARSDCSPGDTTIPGGNEAIYALTTDIPGYEYGPPAIAMATGAVYSSDQVTPAISASHPGTETWVKALTAAPAYLTASDAGLGLQSTHITGPGIEPPESTLTDQDPCNPHGYGCANLAPWTSDFSYSTSAATPEGTSYVTATAVGLSGNEASTSWPIKIDRVPPVVTLSGPAEEANGEDVGDALYGLDIEAKDATSGVKSIEVQVGGKQVLAQTETCTAESCPKTASDDEWVLQGQNYALGEHTITVRATDDAGNVSAAQTIKVTVVATGQTGWYGLQEQALGEGVTTSVNPAGGNFMVESEDLPAEAATDNIALYRYYNSQATPTGGTLGPHWSWSAGPDVFLRISTSAAVLHGANGYIVTLTRQSNGTYSAPEEFEGTLTKNENGTYTLVDEAGPTYQFNSAGAMTGYTDEEARTFMLTDTTVDEKSVLHTLSAATGKALKMAYSSAAQATSSTDPAGDVRHYAYNAAGQLTSYTNTAKAKTEYAYEANGYLSMITMPSGTTETITTTAGKVSSVKVTPKTEAAYEETFVYKAAAAPACETAVSTGETVVTRVPAQEGETPQTYCYNGAGDITGESGGPSEGEIDESAGTEEPEEVPVGTCYSNPNFTADECDQEDLPPEDESTDEATPTLLQPMATVTELEPTHYGISDNNKRTNFPLFSNTYFKQLGVVNVRRVIPWDLVPEARAGAPSAQAELEEDKTWVTEVKKLSGETGQPLISFGTCDIGANNTWVNPLKPSLTETQPCEIAPSVAQYKKAMEEFFEAFSSTTHRRVIYFTAWNEPNFGTAAESPHRNPLWDKPELAGEYWHVLDALCEPKQHGCQVAAGDFLDTFMNDAYHKAAPGHTATGEEYFEKYYHGMKNPTTAYRWAWHAYTDGERTLDHPAKPQEWWPRFKNFVKAIAKIKMAHTPEIWLTEQGVVFSNKDEKHKAYGNAHNATAIMHAYVDDGAHSEDQLTRVTSQIKRFYYYDMQGEVITTGNQDSGLLHPSGAPRHIFYIYRNKTPR